MSEARGPILMTVAGLTDAGKVRAVNEDSFRVSDLAGELSRGPAPVRERLAMASGFALGVYDATGGGWASATAARLIHAPDVPEAPPHHHDELRARLARGVAAANRAIVEAGRTDPARRGAGTTATVVALMDEHLVVASVGDSRAYLLRGRDLIQLTRDDTLVNAMLADGKLRPDEVDAFPHKTVLLRALGVAGELQVGVHDVDLRRGDTVVLCTDGLTGLVADRTMRATLLRHRDPGVACRVLIDEALRAGGGDNVTVIVARFEGEGLPAPYADERAVNA